MKQFKILSLILASLVSLMLVTNCSDDSSTGSDDGGVPENMVLVEGGTFMMGSKDDEATFEWETPVHEVMVGDFYMGKYEVTNEEFCEFLNAKGTSMGEYEGTEVPWIDMSGYTEIEEVDSVFTVKDGKEKYPAAYVTWFGAWAYCEWKGGRLPTEAEWEYAARGGKESKGFKYSGSDNLDEVAWYGDSAGDVMNTHPVGEKAPNELGIYDMSGNVWEWINDYWGENYYQESPNENPQGPQEGTFRVLRGGDWHGDADLCRVSYRYFAPMSYNDIILGFRLVIDKK